MRHGDRRVFPRPRPRRALGDGFAHAAGARAARDRAGRRRAADDARFSALGVRLASQASRTGRTRAAGQHHRLLLGAGRGRRSARTDLRRGPRAVGRPRLARASWPRAAHYPAIDVLESVSRLMVDVTSDEHQQAAARLRELAAVYRDHEDLISIGAYRRGANAMVDRAIDMQPSIAEFLRQKVDEPSSVDRARQALLALDEQARNLAGAGECPLTTDDHAANVPPFWRGPQDDSLSIPLRTAVARSPGSSRRAARRVGRGARRPEPGMPTPRGGRCRTRRRARPRPRGTGLRRARRGAAGHEQPIRRRVTRRIDSHVADERAAAALVERSREALVEADRGVRVLEKLRERQLEQFEHDQRTIEFKRLDEISATTRRRSGVGAGGSHHESLALPAHARSDLRKIGHRRPLLATARIAGGQLALILGWLSGTVLAARVQVPSAGPRILEIESS